MVASLWQVDDEATALLMARFYENLLGARAGSNDKETTDGKLSKLGALREAQNWLRSLSWSEAKVKLSSLPRGTGGFAERRPAPSQDTRPFEHPYFWAAFVVIGDPD